MEIECKRIKMEKNSKFKSKDNRNNIQELGVQHTQKECTHTDRHIHTWTHKQTQT